ncbi:MAG TPA: T9SS type A sorting domain-containing protein, partial [Flavobacteriaceae bacterium]|nr:T9SS type A sorting domain-containing protein [Flavobacteriaceae bacterium]
PSKGVININSTKEISELRLYDLSGKLVNSYKNESKLDLKYLNEGLYFLEFKYLDGNKTIDKLIINTY